MHQHNAKEENLKHKMVKNYNLQRPDSYIWPNAKEMYIPSLIAKDNLSKKCIFSSERLENPLRYISHLQSSPFVILSLLYL